jgi:hypothetical protein
MDTQATAIRSAYERIMKWDFSELLKFHRSLEENSTMTDQEADELLDAYCRFMAMCSASGRPHIAVSRQVDPLWHNHILHTKDYAEFCETFAGQFLHHQPVPRGMVHENLRESYFDKTVTLHDAVFVTDPKFFPQDRSAAICFCAYDIRQAA